ncbi:hypothetical protein ACHAXT_002809 [Thalassiosira profunda]
MAVDIGDGSTDDNATNDPATTPPFSASTKPWENPQSLVGSLLQNTASRAVRTLSTYPLEDEDAASDEKEDTSSKASIETVLDATIVRASSLLDGNGILDGSLSGNSDADIGTRTASSTPTRQHQDKRTYLGNPSVTPTALAHSLWQSSIVPHRDTVIDATCGNGKDCLALARMLFPDTGIDESGGQEDATPQLIGIDIQSRAVQNTKRSLLASLPSDIYYDNVLILEQSHEYLLGVPRSGSVGLVCYNLGYLPGAPSADQPNSPSDYKACQTQTETTLHSITDASLLLRVGGLLSVMTYPGSNLEESLAVEHFAEGLAMITTRDVGGWRGYAERIPDYTDEGRVRTLVTQALERVVAEGPEKQTWRAFTHKPLGRPLSPVLVTAMRIK